MNCISWNCCGLGRPRAVLELTEMVKKHSPSIVFLKETRSKVSTLKNIRSKLNMENVHFVPWHNTGGGPALYWKNGTDLHIPDSSPSHVDTEVNLGVDDAWRFIGFYGNPVTTNQEHSWTLLKHLCLKLDLPWLCLGDFNEIIKAEEKIGGAPCRERQMTDFRSAIDFCGLRDLGYVGSPFTWCNNQFDGVVTWIRLDKGVATTAWTQLFPPVRVHHIAGSLSDHYPLWVCSDDENVRFYKKGRPFRFEVVWMTDERCESVIKNAWDGNSLDNPMVRLVRKVDVCRSSL